MEARAGNGARRLSGKGPMNMEGQDTVDNDLDFYRGGNTNLDFINNQTIGEFVYTEKEKNMRRSKCKSVIFLISIANA